MALWAKEYALLRELSLRQDVVPVVPRSRACHDEEWGRPEVACYGRALSASHLATTCPRGSLRLR